MSRVLTRERALLNSREAVIQRVFRARRFDLVSNLSSTNSNMELVTIPYDCNLDLNDKEDRKLFNDVCARLDKEERLNGQLSNSSKFLKLVGKELEGYRLDDILHEAVEWDDSVPAPRIPTRTANIFN